MFVITADQVRSRSTDDLVRTTLNQVNAHPRIDLVIPADRAAGDEIQLLMESAGSALEAILLLTRSGRWSVGCGVGTVRLPLPASIHEATGSAFLAARRAVSGAKRKETRFALGSESGTGNASDVVAAEAFLDVLLYLRSKRSPLGWEIYDLLEPGRTQAEVAQQIEISPQAVSKRARTGGIRVELSAYTSIIRALERADDEASRGATSFTTQ